MVLKMFHFYQKMFYLVECKNFHLFFEHLYYLYYIIIVIKQKQKKNEYGNKNDN